jgi:glycosyltransferase involved in cell wall biosynthesis
LSDGVRVIEMPVGAGAPLPKDALWPHMPAFRNAIDDFRRRDGAQYDLSHGNFWMSGWVAAELGLRWRIPTVQIFHATGVTKLREQGAADTSPIGRIEVEKAVVLTVDRLIAQCPAERDELLADYGARADQIALIPSAVDTDRFRPVDKCAARQTLEIDSTAEMIVYVGRLVPRKDVRNVIQALARLKARRLAAGTTAMPSLFIVGGDTEEPDPVATPEIGVLRALASELGVLDRVRFVGRRQSDELRLWYSAADVTVTTPWYEPFGLTPLEAMACGSPVIGSRVGGIAFTIADGETGFLVPPRDPEALCARLEEILRDPAQRVRMGRAGRVRVLGSFTWQQVATRTAALYDDLLSERLAPPSDRRAVLTRRGVAGARSMRVPAQGVSA